MTVMIAGITLKDYQYPGSVEQYYPDATDPIDGWFQANFSANAQTVEWVIKDIFGGTPEQIVDPFCGAGSTGVAARRMGAPFIGIELDPVLAEIALLKASLSIDDIPVIAESLPPVVSADWLTSVSRALLPQPVMGASLVSILSRPPFGLPSAELLALLSTGVASTPTPDRRTCVNWGDSRETQAWHGTEVTSGTVIFASPPFDNSAVGRPEDSITDVNLRNLRNFIATSMIGDRPYPEALKSSEPAELISSVLAAGRQACGDYTAIIEYEDNSASMQSLLSVIETLSTLPGMEVKEILRTGNFSGNGILYEIVAESNIGGGDIEP